MTMENLSLIPLPLRAPPPPPYTVVKTTCFQRAYLLCVQQLEEGLKAQPTTERYE